MNNPSEVKYIHSNPATRYVAPQTGDWIVVDDVTGDIIQLNQKKANRKLQKEKTLYE